MEKLCILNPSMSSTDNNINREVKNQTRKCTDQFKKLEG